jgi:excisionase family DNA binding protein
MTEPTEYLKISEVAKRYNVGSKVVRKLIKERVIPTVHFGYRTLRVPSDKLDMALARLTTETQSRKERKTNAS